jgi:hypothetical protein
MIYGKLFVKAVIDAATSRNRFVEAIVVANYLYKSNFYGCSAAVSISR